MLNNFHNEELRKLFEADQEERKNFASETDEQKRLLVARDKDRRAQVVQWLAENKIQTGQDYYHAAWIYQHGLTKEEIWQAHEFANKSWELGESRARYIKAASLDRWLMYQKKPQKYGTQFFAEENRWKLWPVDSNTTDEERVALGVPTLDKLDEVVKTFPKLV